MVIVLQSSVTMYEETLFLLCAAQLRPFISLGNGNMSRTVLSAVRTKKFKNSKI